MKKTKNKIKDGYCLCGCDQKTSICDRNDNRRGYIKGQPHKYITGHHQVINELNTNMFKKLSNGCWEWQGLLDSGGYGRIKYKRQAMTAHRAFYLHTIGNIPEEYVIDHLCHNKCKICKGGSNCQHRKCVNAMHLEAVTRAENVHRGFKSILNKDKVRVIISMNKIFSYTKIAKVFNVSTSTIQHAVERKTWKI